MKDMTATVHELRELKMMREELDAQIEALEDEIKEVMTASGTDYLVGHDWRVTWSSVSSKRLDQKKLKELYPEEAAECTVVATSRRFCVK